MSSFQKLLVRLRASPNSATFTDLENILLKVGCVKRSGKGSHFIYKHPTKKSELYPYGLTIPYQKPMKACYTKQVLDYYYSLLEEEELD